MKILIPLMIAALLFTHCCFEHTELGYPFEDMEEDRDIFEDIEIDNPWGTLYDYPEGGE